MVAAPRYHLEVAPYWTMQGTTLDATLRLRLDAASDAAMMLASMMLASPSMSLDAEV